MRQASRPGTGPPGVRNGGRRGMPALTSTKTQDSATCSGSREAPLRRRLAKVHYRREPRSQALAEAQAGLAEAGQPLPQGLVFPAQLPGVFHPHDLRPGTDGPRSPVPPGLRNECISFARNYTGENWWEIGVLNGRFSTDFTQHSMSHCPASYPNLRWGDMQLAFDRLIDGVEMAASPAGRPVC